MFYTAKRFYDIMKLLVFDCLFDDDKELSDPIDRSPVFMTLLIGVKSYMRVTNITLDKYIVNNSPALLHKSIQVQQCQI